MIQFIRVCKRTFFRVGFKKKIKWVEYRHLGYQINFDAELFGLFRKNQARQVIRLWVLLPVNEMLLR